jgi:amidase
LNRPFIDETWPPSANPVGGPIYVEGVRKGDLLAIKIEDILVAADQSFTFAARRGPIHDSYKWSEAAEPWTHILRHEPGPSGTMVKESEGEISIAGRSSLETLFL